ncbi:hypothetical protein [Tabrizicola sp.]|uniref:hypothetical protein n=1 Tax=Tabrizicola sp. TaxID=2005166 RepID=UPI002FDEB89B
MQEAARSHAEVKNAVIDVEGKSLKIAMNDGHELTLYPDNIEAHISSLSSRQQRLDEVQHHISILLENPLSEAPLLVDELLPAIREQNLFSDILAANPDSAPLVQEPIAPGLSIYYVISESELLRYLTTGDLKRSGLSENRLSESAFGNLRNRATKMEIVALSEDPWIATFVMDGVNEGALMALPEIWEDLSAKRGSIGLIYPSRGSIFVFDANSSPAREIVLAYLRQEEGSSAYPVSNQMYEWSEGGWVLLAH